jgi:hypothetical protein
MGSVFVALAVFDIVVALVVFIIVVLAVFISVVLSVFISVVLLVLHCELAPAIHPVSSGSQAWGRCNVGSRR